MADQKPPIQQPKERGKDAPAPQIVRKEVKVAPECIDSYESALQLLDETVTVGGKPVALFMPDEKAKRVASLDKVARDMGAMALEYATVMNLANQRRAALEAGARG